MKPSSLDTYVDAFDNVRLERDDDGILEVTFHTEGKDLLWNLYSHDEITTMWEHVARDRENRVVIVTGTGDTFIDREHLEDPADASGEAEASGSSWFSPAVYLDIMNTARRLVVAHLDIEVPMIAAVNGHNRIHSEQAFLCDIVLAADGVCFADACHFLVGVPPTDGIQAVLPMAIGMNRARAHMLTGEQFTAEDAHAWGAVWEVTSKADLLPRARELARVIARKPDVVRRTTRALMTLPLKKAVSDAVTTGLPNGGLALLEAFPTELNPYAAK